MHKLEGGFSAAVNRRKHRNGSFWEDRYQCIMVEDGEHLWTCLGYIDRNMVRAGVVPNPCEWRWCGYQELFGEKTRYRLLDLDRLRGFSATSISNPSHGSVAHIERAIAEKKSSREKRRTESVAVGGEAVLRCERLRPRREDRGRFLGSLGTKLRLSGLWTDATSREFRISSNAGKKGKNRF